MTSSKNRFAIIREQLTRHRPSGATDATIDWLTYLLGLVPGIGAPGAIGNKIIADARLKKSFDDLAARIVASEGKIAQLDAGLARVEAIASTTVSHPDLQVAVAEFLEKLRESESEFAVITKDWSRQDLINAVVNADRVVVSADNNSSNTLKDTKVSAKKTELRATNNSYNRVDGTSFDDGSGSVSMHGITQSGHVEVTGNSIGFGPGGMIAFGPPPDLVTATCPGCGAHLEGRLSELRRVRSAQCPSCRRTFPVSIG